MNSHIFSSMDAGRTAEFGRTLAGFLEKGMVLALSGELGAGKTTLVRAIASGLGVRGEDVHSPSYTLVNEYEGRLPIYHFDLYRLSDAADLYDLGYDEYIEGEGVSIVEWADAVPHALPKEYLAIEIEILGDNERRLTLSAKGSRYNALLADVKNKGNIEFTLS